MPGHHITAYRRLPRDWGLVHRPQGRIGLITCSGPRVTQHETRITALEHDGGMKMKTSITLEKEVVADVEQAAREGESRSQVIERLLRQSFAARERDATDQRDRKIINAHADELNEEAVDVLGYQVET